jgi:hypothetical protein
MQKPPLKLLILGIQAGNSHGSIAQNILIYKPIRNAHTVPGIFNIRIQFRIPAESKDFMIRANNILNISQRSSSDHSLSGVFPTSPIKTL